MGAHVEQGNYVDQKNLVYRFLELFHLLIGRVTTIDYSTVFFVGLGNKYDFKG